MNRETAGGRVSPTGTGSEYYPLPFHTPESISERGNKIEATIQFLKLLIRIQKHGIGY